MTDIKTLALKYGGYTSLDKVYLDQLLAGRSEEEHLALITPPPSVVNAYFAELYQKKSPQAATNYFAELTQELNLFNAEPSFTLRVPFSKSYKIHDLESVAILEDRDYQDDGEVITGYISEKNKWRLEEFYD